MTRDGSPDDRPLDRLAAAALAARAERGLLRRRIAYESAGPTTVRHDGRTYVNFASNDYLGLTQHPGVLAAWRSAGSAGAGAAGLITGHTPVHAAAEAALAAWKSTEAAVLLPSGYQANFAIVQTLAALGRTGGADDAAPAGTAAVAGVRFLLDKLAHASLIDAVRQSGQPFRVFPHNGLTKLDRLLADAAAGQLQVVVTESVFSMDGDAADLAGLAELKRRRPFVLVVDEAHGSGVYGPGGAGLLAEAGVPGLADVTLVTLSKALGLAGAAVCGSTAFVSAVENFGRAYVFSTAVPPATAAATLAALAVCRDEPWRQARVRASALQMRAALRAQGHVVPMGDSPIIPVVLGDAVAALDAAAALRQAGLLTVAVRPPTVPPATSRLRITVSAAHTDEQIARLIEAMNGIGRVDGRCWEQSGD